MKRMWQLPRLQWWCALSSDAGWKIRTSLLSWDFRPTFLFFAFLLCVCVCLSLFLTVCCFVSLSVYLCLILYLPLNVRTKCTHTHTQPMVLNTTAKQTNRHMERRTHCTCQQRKNTTNADRAEKKTSSR